MPFEWIDYDRQRTSLEVVGTNTNNIIFLKEHFTDEINMVNTRIDQLDGDSGAFDRLEQEISGIGERVEILENTPPPPTNISKLWFLENEGERWPIDGVELFEIQEDTIFDIIFENNETGFDRKIFSERFVWKKNRDVPNEQSIFIDGVNIQIYTIGSDASEGFVRISFQGEGKYTILTTPLPELGG